MTDVQRIIDVALPRPPTAITIHRESQMADLLPFLHGVDPNMERLRGAFVQRGQDPNGLEDAQHVHNAWVEVHYPLASDELLRQSLQTVGFRAVRMSKLYEFIDAITADVAY